MADLTLTGDVPNLLRPGSPVLAPDIHPPFLDVPCIYLCRSLGSEAVGYVAHQYEEPWTDGTPRDRSWTSATRNSKVRLDLSRPTGRYHALLWLRERGHDLRWAEDQPQVLAWSVLSVARGGRSLFGLLPMWAPESRDNSDWDETRGWIACIGADGWSIAFVGTSGPETGPEGRAAADRAALAAGYALRNDDGLTLPPLPEVPRG